MDYTVTINPENWDVFLKTKPYTFAFRKSLQAQLTKLKQGDRIVVYLAQRVCWSGVFAVQSPVYESQELLYPQERYFVLRLEVVPLVNTIGESYIDVKSEPLFSQLTRMQHVDHTKSGWIYKAQLARSLVQISKHDTDLIIEALNGI